MNPKNKKILLIVAIAVFILYLIFACVFINTFRTIFKGREEHAETIIMGEPEIESELTVDEDGLEILYTDTITPEPDETATPETELIEVLDPAKDEAEPESADTDQTLPENLVFEDQTTLTVADATLEPVENEEEKNIEGKTEAESADLLETIAEKPVVIKATEPVAAEQSEADVQDDEDLSQTIVTELTPDQQTVIATVERIRGLSATEPLQIVYKTRAEIHQEVKDRFYESVSDEDIRQEQELMELLGFINTDFDVEAFYTELYGEEVAGYYDHQTNVMMLPSDASEAENLRTLSHEYTHFLQFSNFPEISTYYDEAFCDKNGEACLLGRAMVEGDATLTEALVTQDRAVMRLLAKPQPPRKETPFDRAPTYYQEALLLNYTYGFSFVQEHYKSGGFDKVNELLLNPPQSAEQLRHPGKYLSDEPVPVSIDVFTKVFEEEGCELIQQNELNELDLFWLFTTGADKKWRLDERTADRAVRGWGGGKFQYGRCDGEPFFFSETDWDSRRDGSEFFDALESYSTKRFGKPVDDEEWIGPNEQRILLEEADNAVYYMILPEDFDSEMIEDLIDELEYSPEIEL